MYCHWYNFYHSSSQLFCTNRTELKKFTCTSQYKWLITSIFNSIKGFVCSLSLPDLVGQGISFSASLHVFMACSMTGCNMTSKDNITNHKWYNLKSLKIKWSSPTVLIFTRFISFSFVKNRMHMLVWDFEFLDFKTIL